MNMFALIVVFLFPAAISSQGSSSNLDHLIDDLSVLSRVTTAIAIRNMALQKTLNVPTVVADLLKVDEELFMDLISLNTGEMNAHVKQLAGEVEKMEKPVLGTKEVNDILSAMEFMSSDTLQNIEDLRSIGNFSVAPLFGMLIRIKLPCDVIDTIHKVYHLLAGETSTSGETTDSLLLFKHDAAAIRKCLNDTIASNRASLSNINNELDTLERVNVLADTVTRFNSQYTKISTLSSEIGKIGDDLRRAENVSDGGKVGTRLLEASQLTKRLKSSLGSPSTLTAGFSKGLEDIVKVQSDLKSEWFREKVSRGKSIEPLESALESFLKSAEQSEKLGAAWKELMSIDDKKVEKVATMVTSVENIKVVLGPVEESRKIVDGCWTRSPAKKINANDLVKFKKIFEQQTVFESVRKLGSIVVTMEQTMKSEEFDHVFNQFLSLYTDNLKTSEVDQVRENALLIPNMDKLLDVFKNFSEFKTVLLEYDAQIQQIVQSPVTVSNQTIDLNGLLNDSNILSTLYCLKNTTFGSRELFSEVSEVRNTLPAMSQLKKEQIHLQLIESFLKRVVGVQTVVKTVEQSTEKLGGVRGRRSTPSALLSKVNDAHGLSMHLGDGIRVLRGMAKARNEKQVLLNATRFPDDVLDTVRRKTKVDTAGIFWTNPEVKIQRVLDALDALEVYAETARNKELRLLAGVFKEAQKVPGIGSFRELFTELSQMFPNNSDPKVDVLKEYDLDFAKHQKSLDAAYISIDEISDIYDEMFGFKKDIGPAIVSGYGLVAALLTLAALVGTFVLILVVIAMTRRGRRLLIEQLLNHFRIRRIVDRRLRFRKFINEEGNVNILVFFTIQGNFDRVKEQVMRGANVDAYDYNGQTALHAAVDIGNAKLVEYLIRHGANRTLLNSRNETPLDAAEQVRHIREVFAKFENKTFKCRVPVRLEMEKWQIIWHREVPMSTSELFGRIYRHIQYATNADVMTHYIVRTDSEGVLSTSDIRDLQPVFRGAIVVTEQWALESIKRKKTLENEDKFLVKSVRFNDTLFPNSAERWQTERAAGAMPYLFGVHVVFKTETCLSDVVQDLGATILDSVPVENRINTAAHPLLHSDKAPVWIVVDSTTDTAQWRNRSAYSLFTEDELVAVLLARNTRRIVLSNPPHAFVEPN